MHFTGEKLKTETSNVKLLYIWYLHITSLNIHELCIAVVETDHLCLVPASERKIIAGHYYMFQAVIKIMSCTLTYIH